MLESFGGASRRSVFLFVWCFAASGAGAADKTTKTPLLTPAQLRDCVSQKQKLQSQVDDALKDKAGVEADKAEIARSGTELAAEVATLDKTSPEAVAAFNDKVQARDKMIETYETKVTAYNAKAEAVKNSRASYETSCENQRYDERDLSDPKPKKP